ncbi:DUF4309 domain-containing protein [Paenibacillus sp. V4I5]|uniref:DUF4309 domain-containing protein n=1 Tax=Paenibacillus sp. V4I5 TaxID=3042306 RepID=UPI00278F078E|nr:DUF4309 domain-containing protein [Paenibacillus sp. V4I5]MDQ0920583.1 hypothetical protein [Paenibacillus sp. V4I5]
MLSKATGVCLLMSMLMFSACTNVEGPLQTQVAVTNSPAKIGTEEGKSNLLVVTENKGNSCQLILDKELLKTAEKGQLKGIKANLSSSKNELEESYGKPDVIGFENAEYLKYDNCYFYIWGENKISVIDIKINFSVEKVKEVLGKPDFEGSPDAGFDEYALGYKTEEYYLYFKYHDKESTVGVFRFKKL